MESLFNDILNKYEIFLMILVRMTGLFLVTPIFSRNNIPNIMKIGFSFLCSIILVNVLDIEVLELAPYELIILSLKELLVGLMLGFISYLFFSSLYLAGQVIDMQIGFGMVNIFDPQNNIQVPVMGTYYYLISMLLFLIFDGHHILLDALVQSYEYIPVGQFKFINDIISQLIRILSKSFMLGFKISAPILASIFLADVLLGILAKTMPQMNVFIVGMPLKILVGLATIIITLPLFIATLQHIFTNMYEEIFNFLKVIQKG